MDINNDMIVDAIMPHLSYFETLGKEFAKSRFLVNASEFGTNSEESAELEKISESIKLSLSNNGANVKLLIEYGDSPYLTNIQEGQEAPLTGGTDGIVTHVDGSESRSLVPEQLQGYPITKFAKLGEDVMGEVKTMLESLFREAIIQAFNEASPEVMDVLKPEIVKQINNHTSGGGSA